MIGYMQTNPGGEQWRKHFFSEFIHRDHTTGKEFIEPGFDRTIVHRNEDVAGDEEHVGQIVSKWGRVSRYELETSAGIVICLGVLSNNEGPRWKELVRKLLGW